MYNLSGSALYKRAPLLSISSSQSSKWFGDEKDNDDDDGDNDDDDDDDNDDDDDDNVVVEVEISEKKFEPNNGATRLFRKSGAIFARCSIVLGCL